MEKPRSKESERFDWRQRVLSFHLESSSFHTSFFFIYNTYLSYFSVMHYFKITKLKVFFCVISYRNNVFLSFLPKMPGIGPQMEGQDLVRKAKSRIPQEHYLQLLLCFSLLGGPTSPFLLLPHPHSSFGPGLPPSTATPGGSARFRAACPAPRWRQALLL